MQSDNPNSGQQTPSIGGIKLDGRTIAIGIIVILALVLIVPRLFNTDNATNNDTNTTTTTDDTNNEVGEPATNPSLGTVVSAANVDREGCPADETTTFDNGDTIYVGVNNSNIPQGTDMFARLYFDGEPIEDTDVITADADYSCVAFSFDATTSAEVMESGDYEAQLFVNGNPGDSVAFSVR